MDEASDKPEGKVSRIFPEARRRVSEDELRGIVEAHKQWLEGKEGEHAKLQGADLTAAKLQGADLTGVNLQGAFLAGANLSGADLTYSERVTLTQLDQACGDTKTKLPDHLTDYKMRPCYSQSLKRSEESD